MRLTVPEHAAPTPSDHPNRLRFRGERGEQIEALILDHALIRVRFLPDGAPRLDRTWWIADQSGDTPLEGRSREQIADFPLPDFRLEQGVDAWIARTDALALTLHLGDFRIDWADATGAVFASDLPHRAYTYDLGGREVRHYVRRTAGERYFGLGEVSGALDKHGSRFRMMPVDALGYNAETSDPLYKHFPFVLTLLPNSDKAYGVLYDNPALTTFDLGKEIDAYWGFYRFYAAADGDIDYTLIYGTIPQVVERLSALIGRSPLPPRWSLGYLGSTMSYTEAPDAQAQLRQFIDLCRQHEIPCDMFHLGSGYTTDERGWRCVFTWNRRRIPDPPAMAAAFRAAGMHLAANIKPLLLTTHPRYAEVAALGGFIRQAEADAPQLSRFWSGGAFESADGSYLDFSGAGYGWWKAQIRTALLDVGIDAVWNDNNEFEIWDDAARLAGFGRSIPVGVGRPLQTLWMARASYEALREYAPDLRPFVLTRSACPGVQRYAQTWSGDNATSWHTLQWNIPMGLSLSLSGMPNTGHDVGGFYGDAPDFELLIRWVQCGVFFPRFAIHSWNTDGTVNAPWMYPEALPYVRAAIRLRYRLIPYLYTLLDAMHRTGAPIMRPLVYHFPDDPRSRDESFAFLLGAEMLIAPVYAPGARTWRAYLPPGAWFDFHTGAQFNGGREVAADAPLDRIPVFARANALIPMGGVMRHVGELPDNERTILAFPTTGRADGLIVEDDGVSLAYQRGEQTRVALTMESDDRTIRLAASARGGFALPYAVVTFVLPPGERRRVYGGVSETRDADKRRQIVVQVGHGH